MADSSTHRLELLDADQHHALQTWPLDTGRPWSVGRARTNDIVLASPLVSRQHATMRFVDDCWLIEAQSELGVWWRGGLRSRVALETGIAFALGEHGPRLRLARTAVTLDDFDAGSTIRFRPENLGVLNLDTVRRDKEVAEIVDSDFFRHLEKRAGTLRAKAKGDASTGQGGPELGLMQRSVDGPDDGRERKGG
jgi:pSer/pThr/pTyr-binding forkhead associated (FHA) protein